MEKKVETSIYVPVKAKIIGVSGKDTILRIAKEKGLNPQNVFVRIIFETKIDGKTVQCNGSNQLRFFGKDGYTKLLAARESGEEVDLTLRHSDKGDVIYLHNQSTASVDDLFATPVEKATKSMSVEDACKILKSL